MADDPNVKTSPLSPYQAPQLTPVALAIAAPKPETKTFEQWAIDLETPTWLLAAARVKHGWGYGQELTQVDFEAALDAAANEVIL